MNPNKTKHGLLIFLLFAVSLVAGLYIHENIKRNIAYQTQLASTQEFVKTLENTPVVAQAVSVYDITKSKKIYGKNDDISMPMASLAKILTVTVALSNHPKDDVVSISGDAIKQDGDYGLFANEKWNINDLAKLTLLNSANDGAYELGGGTDLLEKINSKAQKIGMTNTFFLNVTGLDLDSGHAGAFASASDVNLMAAYAESEYPDVFSATTLPELNLTSLSGFTHNFKNTDLIVDKIPNLIFSKTGYTDVAGGNLCIIFKDKKGDDIAITVMGSTMDGRFTDMENLVNILYNN